MDDASKCQDIPKFIQNALEQLISIKAKTSSIDDFNNDLKQIDTSINSNIVDFANKFKEYLIALTTSITDISNIYIENYKSFIKENDKEPCRFDSDGENTESGSKPKHNKKLKDKNAKDSENNVYEKDDKSENEETSNNSKNKKNGDETDTESINNSVINSSVSSDLQEQTCNNLDNACEEQNHIQNAKDKNVDSDKENTADAPAKSKENDNMKTTPNNKSDIEDNHIESKDESDSVKSRKKNNIITVNDDSDSDESIILHKTKSKVKKNMRKKLRKSKIANSSDTEEFRDKRKNKSKKHDNDYDSDKSAITNSQNESKLETLDKMKPTEEKKNKSKKNKSEKCDNDSDSGKSTASTQNESKIANSLETDELSNEKKNKSKIYDSDSDSNKSNIKSQNESKTVNSSDAEEPSDDIKNKSKKRKSKKHDSESESSTSKNNESKIVNSSDAEEPPDNTKNKSKKHDSESESSITTSKNNESKTVNSSDAEEPSDDIKNKSKKRKSKKHDSESESSTSKNNESKIVNSSDAEEPPDNIKNKSKKSKSKKHDSKSESSITTSKNNESKTVNSSDAEEPSDDIKNKSKKRKSKKHDSESESNTSKNNESKTVISSDVEELSVDKKNKTKKSKSKNHDSESESSLSNSENKESKTVNSSDIEEPPDDRKNQSKKHDSESESSITKSQTNKSSTSKNNESKIANSSDSDEPLDSRKIKSKKHDSDLDSLKSINSQNFKLKLSNADESLDDKKKKSKKNKSKKDNSDSDSDKSSTETHDRTYDSDSLFDILNESKNNKDQNPEKNNDTIFDNLRTENKDSTSAKKKTKEKATAECKVVLEKFDINSSVLNSNKENLASNVNKDNDDAELSENIESVATEDLEGNKAEKEDNKISNMKKEIDNTKEEIPKIGLIKCIDINKLLDPNKKNDNNSVKVLDLSKRKDNNSVIVLSSSESDTEQKSKRNTRSRKQKVGEKESDMKKKNKLNNSKVEISDSDNSKNKGKENNSEIVINDSDSSSDEKSKKKNKKNASKKDSENIADEKRKKKSNNSAKYRDSDNSSDEDNKKKNTKNKESSDSENSSLDRKRRTRFNRKKGKLDSNKKKFETLKNLRQRRAAKIIKIINSSSSESESGSESSSSSVSLKKVEVKNKTSQNKEKKRIEIDPNYDYKTDNKFKLECYVSLPKIPVEKLKEKYLQDKEDAEINRLTNMKSLKRTRQQKDSPSSSDNDVKSAKKRSRRQEKKNKENESEHSETDTRMSDEPIVPEEDTSKKNDEPTIPKDFLDSDGGSNKPSDSSDNEDKDGKKSKRKKNDKHDEKGDKNDKQKEKDDKDDKKSKSNKEKEINDKDDIKSKSNKDKEKSDKENEQEDEKDENSDKDEDNSKKSDDDDSNKEKDKEKSKWRNDSLLKGKLSCSDSEDELIRFKNKKNKVEEAIRSKTKKQLKRIARRLGSDVSSSEDENDDKESNKKSDSDKESSESEEEKKKKPKRRRIKRMKDSDESSDGEETKKKEKKKKEEDDEEQNTRKKIRNVWSKDSLAKTTIEAAKEEEERKKRIAERQKLYNEIYQNKTDINAKVDKVVLDFNEETKEELLSVHPDLVSKLKPHQGKGVQFMWTACFESLERAQNTEGSGCILAHCMGLGKTLQVITLIHTLLTNTEKTNVKTVLVVCPLSTVLNWVNEFKKWLDDLDSEQVNVFDLVQYKQNYERLYQMQDWMKYGGVLVMGYDMFRNLSNPNGKKKTKKLLNGFNKVLLEPGPDLVICDEGHLLKNEKTGISIAMNRLRTKRRIVLTGTPLQNNLKEYFCMVQFVKPNLLGTYKEYLNRFVNPITNGQYTDSTQHDIQIMRRRAHVLHKMLDAIVERRDYNVLAPFLPPKHEYVLFITLTETQIQLYREYLTKYARDTSTKGVSFLFKDFQEFQRICIHPRVLLDKSNQDRLRMKDLEDDESEGSLKDFINDDDTDKSTTTPNESSSDNDSDSYKKPAVTTRKTRSRRGEEVDDHESEPEILNDGEWWSKFCQDDVLENIKYSSKILLLFDILRHCEQIGDKILVFSQSLFSLNLIEYFLAKIDEATQSNDPKALEEVGGHTGSWAIGLDYFRLDGSTSCDNRALWCKSFNNEANTRARLFLISTRAGGLGINLVAANRVIIFDVSWNPSFDIQSIYRVYRFGQTKPCYIYRFVTQGTMENKIYERQVTKQAISKRVIDEQQIDRHYNQNDLAELYAFNPIPDEERPTPNVPKDRLFADLLQNHTSLIYKYHEHNSLLENKADEGLNEEERQAAWEEFENEKKAPKFNLMQTMVRNGMYETLRILVQEDNNGWTPAQINNILPAIVQRISEQVSRQDYSMYRRVEERHEMRVMEQRRMQMFYQQYIQQLRNASGGAPLTPADMSKLAQMFSAYNQNVMQQQPQPASSSTGVFRQDDLPAVQTVPPPAPKPHPAVSGVVELND